MSIMDKRIESHKNYGMAVCYKAIDLDVKADVASRKVSGYLCAFGNKDSDEDIILPGSFAKSISERGVSSSTNRKIAYLWQHNMKEPLGKFDVLQEDSKGLYFEASISKFDLGDRVLTQYSDGTLDQHSIGFRYIWDKIEWSEDEQAYIVKELNLFEGSVVTMGANENTPFTGFKAEALGTAMKGLDKDFEDFIRRFSPDEAYKLRQYAKDYLSLGKAEPFDKNTLKTASEPVVPIEDVLKQHFPKYKP